MHSDSSQTLEWQLANLRQALEALRRAKHHDGCRAAIQAVQQQLAALEAAYRHEMRQHESKTRSGMKRAA